MINPLLRVYLSALEHKLLYITLIECGIRERRSDYESTEL